MFRLTKNLAKIKHMTIIGAGQMGAGIAQVSAQVGIGVTLVDLDDQLLEKALGSIDKSISRVVKKKFKDDPSTGDIFKTGIMSRISIEGMDGVNSAVHHSDLVIEAIIENLEIKQKLFADLDSHAPENCIFATNTSSLSVREIFNQCSESRQANSGGLHFFNPVPMMKLLEVVRADGMTSDATFHSLLEYGQEIKKTVVKCEDTPGFLVNRLLVPYLYEAIRLHERGHGSIEDIDTAMKLGAGHPMGPFELADYVGLDTCKQIVDGWRVNDPENPLFAESKLLNELVAAGRYGRKTGWGFHDYRK